jgi:hypothetical protein
MKRSTLFLSLSLSLSVVGVRGVACMQSIAAELCGLLEPKLAFGHEALNGGAAIDWAHLAAAWRR